MREPYMIPSQDADESWKLTVREVVASGAVGPEQIVTREFGGADIAYGCSGDTCGALVVWSGIHARALDATGAPIGNARAIAGLTGRLVRITRVDSGFMLAYEDGNEDIVAVTLDRTGVPTSSPRVVTTDITYQHELVSQGGSAWLFRHGGGQGFSGDYHIFMHRIDMAGPVGEPRVVASFRRSLSDRGELRDAVVTGTHGIAVMDTTPDGESLFSGAIPR